MSERPPAPPPLTYVERVQFVQDGIARVRGCLPKTNVLSELLDRERAGAALGGREPPTFFTKRLPLPSGG